MVKPTCSGRMSEDAIAGPQPLFIAGPCVIESEALCLETARRLANLARSNEIRIIFKASFDKANRTSARSFRGVGMDEGLEILRKVKEESGLEITTDIHTPEQAERVGRVVDVIQIPAFLCRQTDLLAAAGETGKTVNIKKGQFMSPGEMRYAVEKVDGPVWITERGTFFGYTRLVVDFAGMVEMRRQGLTVIFDATHSVQRPGAGEGVSTGVREAAVPLARAALAVKVDGLFMEVHPNPDEALCDGPNSLSMTEFEREVPRLLRMSSVVRESD